MRTTKKTVTELMLLTLVGACDPDANPRLICPAGTVPVGEECTSEEAVDRGPKGDTSDDEESDAGATLPGQNVGGFDASTDEMDEGSDGGLADGRGDAAVQPRVCIDTDVPDIDFDDANCDGIDGDRKLAVFVSPNGDDQGDGSEEAPFATLQKAMMVANEQGKSQVLVAGGNYVSTVVMALLPGVSLYGGYDPETWERSRDHETFIAGPNNVMLGIVASGSTIKPSKEPVTLSLLTIQASDASIAGGNSIALQLTDLLAQPAGEPPLSVRIEDCEIFAGRGGDGQDAALTTTEATRGNDGLMGAFGRGYYINQSTCTSRTDDPNRALSTRSGGTSPTCRSGSTIPGAGGNGGFAGSWSPGNANTTPPAATVGSWGGVSGGAVGRNGNPGADGSRGSDGTGGAEVGSFAFLYTPADGAAGAAGFPGQAGGGGGGSNGCYKAGSTCGWVSGATGGGGGSGGCGGAGGLGGKGGGMSAGIVARNTLLTLVRTHVMSAQGGRGGRGAAGLGGAEGGRGAPGGNPSALCSGASPGGRGGDGGRGGRGGMGGGGGGGPSIAVVLTAGAQLTSDSADNELMNGQAGLGGEGADQVTSGRPGLSTSIYQPR